MSNLGQCIRLIKKSGNTFCMTSHNMILLHTQKKQHALKCIFWDDTEKKNNKCLRTSSLIPLEIAFVCREKKLNSAHQNPLSNFSKHAHFRISYHINSCLGTFSYLLFNFFYTSCLAEDHWLGFSTRNAHIVHIVN